MYSTTKNYKILGEWLYCTCGVDIMNENISIIFLFKKTKRYKVMVGMKTTNSIYDEKYALRNRDILLKKLCI